MSLSAPLILAVGLVVLLLFFAARALTLPPRGRRRPRLTPLRYEWRRMRRRIDRPRNVTEKPYAFARTGSRSGTFLDRTTDGNDERLHHLGLPVFRTPMELAAWLDVRIGELAWLTHFDQAEDRPTTEREAHYVFHWKRKRSGGHRLIESPKPLTRRVQHRILDEVLARVPPHPAAHGFVAGRSITTNARLHVGQRVVLKLDLEGFFPSVRFNRVVALFRAIGYCREAASWLARLCTSAVPTSLRFPEADALALHPYFARHLPQGAPTSPALANLSAFSLDVRLAGLSRAFGGTYTRYADDLTFSGNRDFLRSFRTFIPLAQQVVRQERFRVNVLKRRVLRSNQRQTVTGVVVNERLNPSRADFDRLKAILHNCLRYGPSSQNREAHPDFAAHLRGRIAHVQQLNPVRGEKLLETYLRIDWSR